MQRITLLLKWICQNGKIVHTCLPAFTEKTALTCTGAHRPKSERMRWWSLWALWRQRMSKSAKLRGNGSLIGQIQSCEVGVLIRKDWSNFLNVVVCDLLWIATCALIEYAYLFYFEGSFLHSWILCMYVACRIYNYNTYTRGPALSIFLLLWCRVVFCPLEHQTMHSAGPLAISGARHKIGPAMTHSETKQSWIRSGQLTKLAWQHKTIQAMKSLKHQWLYHAHREWSHSH